MLTNNVTLQFACSSWFVALDFPRQFLSATMEMEQIDHVLYVANVGGGQEIVHAIR